MLQQEWTTVKEMKSCGYDLVDNSVRGYALYKSDGNRKDGYGFLIAKGRRIIGINYTNDRDVIIKIEEDGGTRTSFYGLIRNKQHFIDINSVLI